MDREVVWSSRAEQDLQAIGDYITSRGSPENATRFVTKPKNAGNSLVKFPELGRIVPDTADPDLREIIVRPYRIMYHISSTSVEILGVFHGARDFGDAWRERLE